MNSVTLRVIDGADRGRVFDHLETPLTIGREEGNSVQLNDERVSRFHLKIQIDHDKLVLTDLESTNGTRVNGEDIQLRILRFGDLIVVGRSVLLFGSREQIISRLSDLKGADASSPPGEDLSGVGSDDIDLNWSNSSDMHATLHALRPPELPDRMTPGQAAQLVELIEYFHIRLRNLVRSAVPENDSERQSIEQHEWQQLLDLQSRLAEYLREIGNPHSSSD